MKPPFSPIAFGLTLTLALTFTFPPAPLLAAGGPPPWAGQGQGRAGAADTAAAAAAPGDDLAALERFLSMTDEELDRLQQAVARVRAMSPAERAALREKMLEYRRLSTEQREQVRRGWGWVTDADRGDWPAMMRSRSDAERSAIQDEIQALPPEQRAARKHELLETWRAAKAPRPAPSAP